MKIAVLKEAAAGERRVSATPETVRKSFGLGATVTVEKGAGGTASIGARALPMRAQRLGSRADALKDADILLGVAGSDPKSFKGLKQGAWLVAGLNPFGERARFDDYAALGI